METIREYLNNLFMSLPETPEVLRAKANLLEMMEDKYEELTAEGKSEKEAVGIIISEFGNLEELAAELGIDGYIHKDPAAEAPGNKGTGGGRMSSTAGTDSRRGAGPEMVKYHWTIEDVKNYIRYAWSHGTSVALGVLLCIAAPYFSCVMDGAGEAGYLPEYVVDAIGTSGLFLMVTVGVVLFCRASAMTKQVGNLRKCKVVLEGNATQFVGEKRSSDDRKRLRLRVCGIALCILWVLPSCLNFARNPMVREMLDSSILVIVAVGVFLLVLSASVGNRYQELEKGVKNAGNPWGGEYTGSPFPGYVAKGTPGWIICSLVFGGLFLIIVAGCISGGLAYHYSAGEGEKVNETSAYEIGTITKLEVDMDIGDLEIIGDSSLSQIQIDYSGTNRAKPEIQQSGETLQIKEPGRKFQLFNFRWFHSNQGRELVIRVPQTGEQGLAYQLDMDAGNVMLADIHGSALNADVDMGTVTGENCVFAGKSKIDVDAGNAEFYRTHFYQLEGNVDAGNFELETYLEKISQYDMELNVDLGKIRVNGQEVSGEYKQAKQDGSPGDYRLDVNVDLGDIVIREGDEVK